MKKIFFMFIISCLFLSFCISKSEENNGFNLAFIKEVYIDKGELENDIGEKEIRNFIGIFPKENDTVIIYKLNDDLKEISEKFSFWSKRKDNKSITFYCSEEEVKVTFSDKNNIIVNNDNYTVNNEYYNFLKVKVLNEGSILDLCFFLKDGYGDYAQSLEPLNKNWRNQKENNTHKIISANIKNKNNQTDDQYFNYKFNYEYDKNGVLKSIDGENRYSKKIINNKGKYVQYSISNGENERSLTNQILYRNRQTLFDSIVGNTEQYSISKTSYYIKYQSKLKSIVVNTKPKGIEEFNKLFGANHK